MMHELRLPMCLHDLLLYIVNQQMIGGYGWWFTIPRNPYERDCE